LTKSVPPYLRALLLLLLGNALIHAGLGFSLGLSGDEAHYALYAAHPALSYYDHPPLVGWLQIPLVWLGAPAGVLRLLPGALWLATAVLVHALGQRLHQQIDPAAPTQAVQQSGWWALLAFSLAPLPHVLGMGLLPDTLLMCLTAALMLQTLRLLDHGRAQQLLQWLLLGALLGLAGLAKYTAIFVALPVAACLLATHGASLLRRAAPWWALTIALVLVAPVFVWNAQNHWMSFVYQLHHGAGSDWRLAHLATFLLVQALLYPLLLWGALAASRPIRNAPGSARWLLSFALLPLAALAYLAGGGSSLPHWTAPAWVALAPVAGIGLQALWRSGRRRLVWLLGSLQVFLCLALYVLMLSAGPPWLQSRGDMDESINPFSDFYGWEEAGVRARRWSAQLGIPRLAVQNWTLASRLAWYAQPLPVHVIAPGFDQFSLWSGELPRADSAILLGWSQMAYHLPVGAGQFAQCEALDRFAVVRAGRPVAHFSLHACKGWGGQPQPRRIGEP